MVQEVDWAEGDEAKLLSRLAEVPEVRSNQESSAVEDAVDDEIIAKIATGRPEAEPDGNVSGSAQQGLEGLEGGLAASRAKLAREDILVFQRQGGGDTRLEPAGNPTVDDLGCWTEMSEPFEENIRVNNHPQHDTTIAPDWCLKNAMG